MSLIPMQTLQDDFVSAQLSGHPREALRFIVAFERERSDVKVRPGDARDVHAFLELELHGL